MMNMPLPFMGGNREKLTPPEYAKGIIGVVVLIAIIILYSAEFQHFSNTFQIEQLVIRSLLFGAIVGGVLAFFYVKKLEDGLDRFKVYVFFVLVGMTTGPLFGCLSNRIWSDSNIKKEQVRFEQQAVYSASRFGKVKGQLQPDGFYLFFIKDGKIERLKTKTLLLPKDFPEGDTFELSLRNGLWGYQYFLEKDQN